MDVSFTVPAVPVAQPRQRHRIAGAGKKQFVQNYTPAAAPVQDYKATVRLAWIGAIPDGTDMAPTESAVIAWFTFLMPRPKRLMWKTKPMPRSYHTAKPDLDNLEKSTLDALEGLAFKNDSQVAWKASKKYYASGDEQPHVEIRIVTETEG